MDYVMLVIFGLGGMALALATRYIWVYAENNIIRAICIPIYLFAALVAGFLISLGEFKNRARYGGEAWMEMPFGDLLKALAPLAIQAWGVELFLGFLLFWLLGRRSNSTPEQA